MKGVIIEDAIIKEITQILRWIGMPANLKGYSYLKYAIILVYYNRDYLKNMMHGLYPEVARKYGTTGKRVERTIRHAIEVACTKGNSDAIYEIFGFSIDAIKSKPTNATFIATVVDQLWVEHSIG